MNLHEIHIFNALEPAEQSSSFIAVLYDYFADKGLPDIFGRDAPFERNRAACDALIRHLHFCFPNEINHQWLRKTQFHRTSDNFIIYTKHWRFSQLYCVLAVITPEAHQRIDRLLPKLIQQAEWFNDLNSEDLLNLNWAI